MNYCIINILYQSGCVSELGLADALIDGDCITVCQERL